MTDEKPKRRPTPKAAKALAEKRRAAAYLKCRECDGTIDRPSPTSRRCTTCRWVEVNGKVRYY